MGDLTIMTFNWDDNRHGVVADFDTLHTSRNFEVLRNWTAERAINPPDHHS
jgi:hypothetical protein